jgi:hypothetical protein
VAAVVWSQLGGVHDCARIVNPCASKSGIDVAFDAADAAFRKRARV